MGPGGQFQPGQTVATAMGGMGGDFDGGYAHRCMEENRAGGKIVVLPWP